MAAEKVPVFSEEPCDAEADQPECDRVSADSSDIGVGGPADETIYHIRSLFDEARRRQFGGERVSAVGKLSTGVRDFLFDPIDRRFGSTVQDRRSFIKDASSRRASTV